MLHFEKDSCFNPSHDIPLDFANMIDTTDLSVFDYHYLYNGAGAAIADFNLDGIKDIFLGANSSTCALLLGQENLEYKNVTEEVGLSTSQWINGVSLVDINHDGRMDIYLSVGGPDCKDTTCENLLFLNQMENGTCSFIECAEKYQLNINDYSQQALFFDADLDGDLDLYQVQNFVDPKSKNYPQPKRYFSKKSFDKFFINLEVETGKIQFVDKSEAWNVKAPGFGLGIAMNDFNDDGYPDLYIANDFITDDILYINQNGNSFLDQSKELLKHTSYNSMGVDIADINGDLENDILVVDMLPNLNSRQKTMLGAMNYDKFLLAKKENYNDQYIRNTVQINNGKLLSSLIPFSDLAQFYGMHETDWSWSPLIADFDNDTDADVFISNGYGKNITDLDFVNYNSNLVGFGDGQKIKEQLIADINQLPSVELSNHLFINQGDGTFSNLNHFEKGITNGVAYGDLDGDGDLDLVQNHLNQASSILVNQSANNYLSIRLKEPTANINAIGARVKLTLKNGKILQKYHAPVRSYLSCMDYDLNFGLAKDSVSQIEIIWPDQTVTRLDTILANDFIVISKAQNTFDKESQEEANRLISHCDTLIRKEQSLLTQHDFSIQALLMKSCISENIKYASNDKMIAVANASNQLQMIYQDDLSSAENIFDLTGWIISDLLFANVDGDDKEEILLTCLRQGFQQEQSQLVVLEQNENGWQELDAQSIPVGIYKISESSKDQSQNTTFVLARYPLAHHYPSNLGPSILSYEIKHKSIMQTSLPWEDKIEGCITDIDSKDLNGDGIEDWVVVGEWMSPHIIMSTGEDSGSMEYLRFDSLKGYWQDVSVVDLDNDGDLDILLGNLGTNTRFQCDYENPIRIVNSDLDDNGSIDPILSYNNTMEARSYTYHSRDDITKQVPALKGHFQDYKSFAEEDFDSILKKFGKEIESKKINYLYSIILENQNGKFVKRALPIEAQYGIINDFGIADFNKDGLQDIIILGNHDQVEIHNGNINAFHGLLMLNKGDFTFDVLKPEKSGWYISEEAEAFHQIHENHYIVSSSKALYYLQQK